VSRGAKSSNERVELQIERLRLLLDSEEVGSGAWSPGEPSGAWLPGKPSEMWSPGEPRMNKEVQSTNAWDSYKEVELKMGNPSTGDGSVGVEEWKSLTKSSPESIVGLRETCGEPTQLVELDVRLNDVKDAVKARQLS